MILSHAGERRARQLVTELETFRRFVVQDGALELSEDALPFYIFAVNTYADLQSIVARGDVFGAFQQTYRGGLSVVNLSARAYDGTDKLNVTYTRRGPIYRVTGNTRSVGIDGVFHEYVHHLLATDQKRRYPTWFHEGYAEYLSRFEATSTGEVRIGQGLPHRIEELKEARRKWIPLGAMFNARGYETGHGQGAFYPQVWSMVHYMLAKSERREKLYRFLDRLSEPAVDLVPVFEEVWGENIEDVSRSIRSYTRSERFRSQTSRISTEPLPEPEVRVLTQSDVQENLAFAILQFQSVASPEALRLVEASIALDRGNIRAYASRAGLSLSLGELDDVKRWVDAAGDAALHDAEIQTIMGHLASLETSARRDAGREDWHETWSKSLYAYKQAIMIDPDAAEAHASLGRLYLFLDGPPPVEALEAVSRARELLPTNFEIELIRAHLLLKRGQLYDAILAYQQVIAWSRVPQTVKFAREMKEKVETVIAEIEADNLTSEKSLNAAP